MSHPMPESSSRTGPREALEDALDAFLSHLAGERGASRHTLDAYSRDLAQLLEHLGGREPSPESLVGFGSALRARGLSDATVARKLAAVRSFFAFRSREEDVEDPARRVRAPRPRRRLPRALERDLVERLLSAPDPATALGRRDRAILELMYSSGLRASEVTGLRLGDLDMRQGLVRASGKGGKSRVVPFGRRAEERLSEWLGQGRPELVSGRRPVDRVFVNRSGGPLSRMGLWKAVKRHATGVGLARRVHPHTLRHTFATHLLEGGADLRFVQELLGHASPATTEIYTHVTRERLFEVHRRFHPAEVGSGAPDPGFRPADDGSTLSPVRGRRRGSGPIARSG